MGVMARSIYYRLWSFLLFLRHWFRLRLLMLRLLILLMLLCVLRQVHVSCEQLRELVLLHVGLFFDL